MKTERQHLVAALKQLDCTLEEIDIFLKLLSSNGLKASEIADRTGIKRVKVYHLLELMLNKGLIYQGLDSKVKKFHTQQLLKIQQLLREKMQSLSKTQNDFLASLEVLNGLQKKSAFKTKVRYYQKEQVPKLLDEVISQHDFNSIFDPNVTFAKNTEVMKKYLQRIQNSPHQIKELISTKNEPLLKLFQDVKNPNYKLKRLDDSIQFTSDLILFENKVFMASYQSDVAIVIEDREIYDSFNSLHAWLWGQLT